MRKLGLFGALLGVVILTGATGCAGYYTYSGSGGYLHGTYSVSPEIGVYVPSYPYNYHYYHHYSYPYPYYYHHPYFGHEFFEHRGHEFFENRGHEFFEHHEHEGHGHHH